MRVEEAMKGIGGAEEDDDTFYECVAWLDGEDAAQAALYRRTYERSKARVTALMRDDR